MKYHIALETLSPLHIGSGQELLANFDYKSDEQYTYVLNQDAIYAQELEQNGPQARLDKPAGELIVTPSHATLKRFVRYQLRGATHKNVERLHEQIKDVYGCCYVPGSSLKGAIRRALAVWIIGKAGPHLDFKDLKESSKDADDAWESHLFGSDPNHSDPNHDALRLLQVGDSLPVSADNMMFCHAAIFQAGKDPGSPVDVEAVSPGVKFQTELRVDELLLQYTNSERFEDAAEELYWDKQAPWFTIIPEILRQVALRLLEAELQTCLDWGWQETAQFYQQQIELLHALPENTALLQVGWGGGWLSKTIGLNLDENQLLYLRQKYYLGKPPKAGEDWSPNADTPFPNSRRLHAITSPIGKDTPGDPFGWVKLTFEPAGAPRDADYWDTLHQDALPLLQKPWESLQAILPDSFQKSVKSKPQAAAPTPAGQQLGDLLIHTQVFTDLPQIGAKFIGEVFDSNKQAILLEIPGLDIETRACAALLFSENPSAKNLKDGQLVPCTVIAIEEESKGYWRVRCKMM